MAGLLLHPHNRQVLVLLEELYGVGVTRVAFDEPGKVLRCLGGADYAGRLQGAPSLAGVVDLLLIAVRYDLEQLLAGLANGDGADPQALDAVVPLQGVGGPVVEGALDKEFVAILRQVVVVALPLYDAVLVEGDLPSAGSLSARVQASGLPLGNIVAVHGDFRRRGLAQLLLEGHVGVLIGSTSGGHDVPAPGLGVRVRASKAEGGHAGVGAVLTQEQGLCQHLAGEPLHVQVRVLHSQVQVGRALTVRDLQHTLEETTEAGTALAVGNVGLGGCDDQGLLSGRGAHDLPEGADLDGIAQRSARAVALEAVNLRGGQVALPEHGVQALLLGRAVGSRQTCTPAILVCLAPSEARHDLPIVLVLLDLETRCAAELTTGISVRRGVEGEASALVAEHARCAAAHEGALVEHQVQTVDNRTRHRLEVLESQVQLRDVRADKGRGARSVDGHTGSLQVQGVGEPVRRDGVGSGRRSVSAAEVEQPTRAHAHPVILVNAHEVSNILGLALQTPLVPPALEERHVGHLHDLALARVHALGLCWRDLEELAVKELDTLDAEAAVPSVGAAKRLVWVPVETVVPAHEGDVSEAIRGSLSRGRPEPLLGVGASTVSGVHGVHSDLLTGRRRRPRAEQAENLGVALD
mmetsp:Transcript_20038/g.62927  ORF Transcript_20038/g.62927 Transcript_20038/m.62927 type:complete len:637 (+) Transcript_20038:98-2008(+)